jgi:hypothetical protein
MSDTPTQRGPPARLDRVLAAYERRARLIAQLHRQAIATANDLLTQRKAIEAGHAKDAQRNRLIKLPPTLGSSQRAAISAIAAWRAA